MFLSSYWGLLMNTDVKCPLLQTQSTFTSRLGWSTLSPAVCLALLAVSSLSQTHCKTLTNYLSFIFHLTGSFKKCKHTILDQYWLITINQSTLKWKLKWNSRQNATKAFFLLMYMYVLFRNFYQSIKITIFKTLAKDSARSTPFENEFDLKTRTWQILKAPFLL